KKKNPDITILPSIGGWTLSDPFYDIASDPARRAVFVESSIDFLRTYPLFDGIDIDWEFPGGGGANPGKGSSKDAQGYADLMKDLREALDVLSEETGRQYELTSAVSLAQKQIDNINYVDASQYVDYFFTFGYDFYGAWNGVLGHQAGLYAAEDEKIKDFNIAAGIRNLIAAGAPAEKLVVGVAMYGRGWRDVQGGLDDNPFTGEGNGAIQGTWEAGILDYRDIEVNYLGQFGLGINGFSYFYDEEAEAPYLWNAEEGKLISFDNTRSAKAKGSYVLGDLGLAGLFSWEIDADNGHILNAMHEGLGHPKKTPEADSETP
ncbi:MAG: glycoside hydrolase family 18 protein, partial [Methylococcales bacterium]|nr:glycoside hydrolase family 18 protein [Methylococcales bacterium]